MTDEQREAIRAYGLAIHRFDEDGTDDTLTALDDACDNLREQFDGRMPVPAVFGAYIGELLARTTIPLKGKVT